MKQRHRLVGDRVPGDAEHGRRVAGDGGQAALGADHRLGRPGGAGGEQQQQPITRGNVDGRQPNTGMGRDHLHIRRAVDQQKLLRRHTGVEAFEEWNVAGIGDDRPAVGMADVVGQLIPATGRVDAHHCGTNQRRAGDPEQELGHVVEEDADVEGPVPAEGQCYLRSDGGGCDELGPRVALVLEEQRRVVVTGPGLQ